MAESKDDQKPFVGYTLSAQDRDALNAQKLKSAEQEGISSRKKYDYVGYLIGIVGALLSGLGIYFYLQSRAVREPVYYVTPTPTEIVSRSKAGSTLLRVSLEDGTPIQNDVSAITIYFWNDGKLEIRPEDVLQSITIKALTEGSKLLETKVIRMSREVIDFKLLGSSKNPEKEAIVKFKILEAGDGAACQLIFEGPADAKFGITGTIVGVKAIKQKPQSPTWHTRIVKIFAYVVLLSMGATIPSFLTKVKIEQRPLRVRIFVLILILLAAFSALFFYSKF